MNNNAIIWGQSYVDLITDRDGRHFVPDRASTDEKTWTPLKNSSGGVLRSRSSSNSSSTYRYTPIRNYWYRSVGGSTMSNTPRSPSIETYSIKPPHLYEDRVGRNLR
jgi:hypothetical protein